MQRQRQRERQRQRQRRHLFDDLHNQLIWHEVNQAFETFNEAMDADDANDSERALRSCDEGLSLLPADALEFLTGDTSEFERCAEECKKRAQELRSNLPSTVGAAVVFLFGCIGVVVVVSLRLSTA